MIKFLTQHGVECAKCKDRIFSNWRHDYVTCRCGSTSIDGGFDYVRVTLMPEIGIPISITRTLDEYPTISFRAEVVNH